MSDYEYTVTFGDPVCTECDSEMPRHTHVSVARMEWGGWDADMHTVTLPLDLSTPARKEILADMCKIAMEYTAKELEKK